MKQWQRIRLERTDITDYVIHFTKKVAPLFEPDRVVEYKSAGKVFREILTEGLIRPTFAPLPNRYNRTPSNTIRGPYPAVCLTEQPLSAALITRNLGRYSGFGIAYHKYALYQKGGRPVLYGSKDVLGKLLKPGESGYQEGKEIYTGGLPPDLQYLFVNYAPTVDYWKDYPVDFTWEREWRFKCKDGGLPLYLEGNDNAFGEMPVGALVVEKDIQIGKARSIFADMVQQGIAWAGKLKKIVSLETVERMIAEGKQEYARIETYPD